MKKHIIYSLIIFIALSCSDSSKLFSKRYLGEYKGTQETYLMNINDIAIEVEKSFYDLHLNYEELLLISPHQTLKGSYFVKADTKMYYALEVKLDNGIVEEWKLWKKGKRLIREAINPEPEIIFLKSKR